MNLLLPACALCLLTAAAPQGQAQTAKAPDPLNAAAPVPPLRYASPFAAYRPLGDDKATPWRQANDAAAGFGGWRAYARELQQPAPAPAPAASAAHGAHPAR